MASPWEQAKAGKKISAPKQSKYHGYQGQAGGSSSIPSQGKRDAFVQLQKQKFFGDRDVPEERVLRRTRQEGGIKQFKDALIRNDRVVKGTRPDGTTYTVMNPNTGEPIYLTDVPGGRSVSDVAQNLAYRFGPTPGEIFGDIGYGLGSIAKGFAEKGTPLMQLFKGLGQEVKNAWDRVRGETTPVEGTDLPQPGSDTKELFSSIDTGIAEIDPNNMLANIARQNQYEDIPFDQLLSNATAQNLNIPKTIQEVVTDVGSSPVVTVDTPLGKVNVNRLTGDLVTGGNVGNLNYVLKGNPLSEGYGANLNYGLGQGLGIEAAMGSGMTSPDVGLGYGGALPYGNYGIGLGTNLGTGDSSLKGQLGFRPVEYLFGPTAFNPTVSLGAQMSPSQNFQPQLSLNFGYKDGGSVNKNSGLGYMLK